MPVTNDPFEKLQARQQISNERFDLIYPNAIANLSEMHWTPMHVAKRAAELLVEKEGARILDVGSGAGKFCLIGAVTTMGLFTGVEQRKHLVSLSRDLADRHKIKRASFIHGNMLDIDWSSYDGFYLFNPFVENLYEAEHRIDNEIEHTWFTYAKHIRAVQRTLYRATRGVRVVTYHGFGGDMPPGYSLALSEPIGSDKLELWVKE